jgi:hypothetical protein
VYPARGPQGIERRAVCDIESFLHRHSLIVYDAVSQYPQFLRLFSKARALLQSCVAELESRELPIRAQLSFTVAADEFDTAGQLLGASNGEPIFRASGVIARVALERHLFTVAESRSIKIQVNPPTKKKPDVEDVITTLVKQSVITPIQDSELRSLFKVGNNCAHPKEPVNAADVGRLIERGRALASVIL